MPIMTTLLASGGILLAGLTGVHPAVSAPAPHAEAAAAAVAASSTTSAFGVSSYTDGQTVSSTRVTLTGTSQPGSRVWLVRGSTIIGGGTTDSFGRWTMFQHTALDQGVNDMTFLVDSTSGSRTEIPFALTVGSAPVVTTAAATTRLSSVYLFSSSVTTEARPVVEGLATPGATISINEPSGAVVGRAVVDSSGMFSVRLTHDLKAGYNELGLRQVLDGAESVSSAAMTYTR